MASGHYVRGPDVLRGSTNSEFPLGPFEFFNYHLCLNPLGQSTVLLNVLSVLGLS